METYLKIIGYLSDLWEPGKMSEASIVPIEGRAAKCLSIPELCVFNHKISVYLILDHIFI